MVIGTVGIGTPIVIDLAKKAEDSGADAIMIVPPYFVYSTYQNIFRHFKTIAETIDLPIVMFHTPIRSGIRLYLEIIMKILEIDNIIGTKDALVFPALAIGAKGAIITGASLFPSKWVELFQKFKQGSVKEARDIQFELMPY